jgi:tRNA nucleotidyltransferase (CCA-adding enzyme)
MNIYLVGGAVRDALLGLTDSDKDWVVVGATPQEMIDAGFTPVGKDFPVFLHRQTHEEYALARTERKVALGYHGFEFQASPEVSLEEDLMRRDLTINAMAQSPEGALIDPYGGQADLESEVFRHVSDAFREDPVRVLRLARFAARFPTFHVHPQTLALCQAMVSAGEVSALVPERVWQECARALMSVRPSRFFEVLHDCGAFAVLFQEWSTLSQQPATWSWVMESLDLMANKDGTLSERWAVLSCPWFMHKALQDHSLAHPAHRPQDHACLQERFKAPSDCQDLAGVVSSLSAALIPGQTLHAPECLNFLQRIDAFRRPERLRSWLQVLGTVLEAAQDQDPQHGFKHLCEERHLKLKTLQAAWSILCTMDTKALTQEALATGLQGVQVGEWIHQQRLEHLFQSDQFKS